MLNRKAASMEKYSGVAYRTLKDDDKKMKKRARHVKPAVVILTVVVIGLLCLAAYLLGFRGEDDLGGLDQTVDPSKGKLLQVEESHGSASEFNPQTPTKTVGVSSDASLPDQESDVDMEKHHMVEPKVPLVQAGDIDEYDKDSHTDTTATSAPVSQTTVKPKIKKHRPTIHELRQELLTIVAGLRQDKGDPKLLQRRLIAIQRALAYAEDREKMDAEARKHRPRPKFKESDTTLDHPRIRQMMSTIHDIPSALDKFDFRSSLIWDYRCVFLQIHTDPNPIICIHDPVEANPVSSSLREMGVYEKTMLDYFLMILKSDQSLQAVDLGAHVGVYSIAAASLGRPVLAVEPNINNIYPFHKSVKMNQFEGLVTLVTNCLSDRYKLVELIYSKRGDLGDTRTVDITTRMLDNDVIEPEDVCRTVTLNDLTPAMVRKKAIMKIDIQGDEAPLLTSGFAFFNRINVKYVLMHWFYSENPSRYDYVVNFFLNRNYRPNASPHGPNVPEEHLKSDRDVIVWIKF